MNKRVVFYENFRAHAATGIGDFPGKDIFEYG
jgi:hypothetical protein